jgi:hypothetical protein
VPEQNLPREPNPKQEQEAISAIFQVLNGLDEESQQRVFQTVAAYYQFPSSAQRRAAIHTSDQTLPGPFSEDRSMSPKTFIIQKQPETDVERVACLAYYLTHYRDIPHFKTLDISMLNTEAAQRKFANATVSLENATKMGYLVPATKGNKQLSAAGEVFVLIDFRGMGHLQTV